MSGNGKKKVGIITIHCVPNFGAVLQTWALVKAVRGLGHEVEVIDFRPSAAASHYKHLQNSSRLPLAKKIADIRLQRFINRRLPLSPLCRDHADLEKIVTRYDTVICGSDQIWHTKAIRGYERSFFLSFCGKETRRIAYAPSVSDLDNFSPHEAEIAEHLRAFDALSGRDERTLELVRGLGIHTIRRVTDPTLLVDFADLESRSPAKRPYLLVYAAPAETAEKVHAVAKRRGLRVIAGGHSFPTADRCYPFITPDRWLGLFSSAEAVVTGAFHGAMFSLKYNRPFAAIASGGRGVKISDALNFFGVGDRLVTSPATVDEHAFEEQLFRVPGRNEKIEQMVPQSLEYLREAIDG